MENQFRKTNAGKGLSIAGFVLGAVATVVCWIPCIGVWAIIPGGVGIILSAIAFAQASRGNGRKGFIIAGLVISIISTGVAIWQFFVLKEATEEFRQNIDNMEYEFENAFDDMEEEGIFDEFDEALEQLEEDLQETTNEINEDLNEEDWDVLIESGNYDDLIDEYELMVNQYIDFVEKAEAGDISAITSYMKAASRLMIFTMKLATIMPNLTKKQLERFNEIDEKYKNNIKE